VPHTVVLLTAVLCLPPGDATAPQARLFPYAQAEEARRLARRECKPLVVHFIPDTDVGVRQLEEFYAGPDRIPTEVLGAVVIVVVPTEKFAAFARDLGLTTPGGYRTLSGYDLAPFDERAVATCRTGFR